MNSITVISGGGAKGKAISVCHKSTKSFVDELKDEGAKVMVIRKYETILGEQLEVDPPFHKILWTY